MNSVDFLKELFSVSSRNILIRSVGGENTGTFETKCSNPKLPKLSPRSNWYFGACPREATKVLSATAIFSDLDGISEISKETKTALKPSAIINSGHGFHVYMYLKEEIPAPEAMRLIRLAQVCLDGDKQAVDITRLLRIPGSMNIKTVPHVPCEWVGGNHVRYDPQQIEEHLLACLLIPYWFSGNRNNVVLGFSTIASRCDWSPVRIEKVIRLVCSAMKDEETSNRVKVVKSTYERHINGDAVTFKEFSECLGRKQKLLLELMRYNVKDGEVKYREEVIGEQATIIQDVVTYFVDGECSWAWEEGQLMEFFDGLWHPRELSSLASGIFNILDELVLLKNGIEKRLPALPKNAEGIARMVKGTLATRGFSKPDANLVGFTNGVLNLETKEFRPAEIDDHIKRVMPVEYDPKAKADNWLRFLEEAVPDAAKFLQEWVGYCLQPGNFFERMTWLYGQQRTGKSTFLSTIFKMFGPRAVTISSQNISQYQIATLSDAYLAVCTELSTQRFRTGVFKALVSGDPITGRHPYGRPFDIEFDGKLMWSSNTLPTIDEAEGVWARIVMIEFKNMPKHKDVMLRSKIMREISGVLNWSLEGNARVKKFINKGAWAVPEGSMQAVARYRDFSEIVDLFIKEEMRQAKNESVTLREAYMSFNEFSKNMGHPTREFGAWFPEEFRRRSYSISDDLRIVGIEMSGGRSSVSWGIKR
jgi:P4 family phage/plasmid primase-like protien